MAEPLKFIRRLTGDLNPKKSRSNKSRSESGAPAEEKSTLNDDLDSTAVSDRRTKGHSKSKARPRLLKGLEWGASMVGAKSRSKKGDPVEEAQPPVENPDGAESPDGSLDDALENKLLIDDPESISSAAHGVARKGREQSSVLPRDGHGTSGKQRTVRPTSSIGESSAHLSSTTRDQATPPPKSTRSKKISGRSGYVEEPKPESDHHGRLKPAFEHQNIMGTRPETPLTASAISTPGDIFDISGDMDPLTPPTAPSAYGDPFQPPSRYESPIRKGGESWLRNKNLENETTASIDIASTDLACANITFTRYPPTKITEGEQVEEAVACMRKTFVADNRKSGYLYMLKCEKHPGKFKIGKAGGPKHPWEPKEGIEGDTMLASQKFRGHPVSERLRAWQKCGHKIIVVYTVYLPSAHGQMESLLQKQLRQCRWAQGPCERHARKGGPGPCHHEWFQVSEDVARDAIDLWACFSASLPYHPSGRLKGRWRQIATEWDEILKKVESKSSVGLMDEWVNKIRGELIPPKGRKRKPRVSDKGGRVKAEPDDGFETEPDDGFESE